MHVMNNSAEVASLCLSCSAQEMAVSFVQFVCNCREMHLIMIAHSCDVIFEYRHICGERDGPFNNQQTNQNLKPIDYAG